MKRFFILLVLCVMLCGCDAFFDGSYHARSPHEEQDSFIQPTGVATDSQMLQAVMQDLVATGTTSAVINVTGFDSGTIQNAMAAVCDYIRTGYPLGAWAVKALSYEIGCSGSMQTVCVNLDYLRSQAQLRRVRTVADVEAAQAAIGQALVNCETEIVLLVEHYEETDFAQLVSDYADENPNLVMEKPLVFSGVYPETGVCRVVELKFTYQTSRDSLRNMQNQVQPVFSAARLYVSGAGSDLQKFSQLYGFLMERFDYDLETSITPAYSLLCHGVGDSRAFATVYAAMCRHAGLTCIVINGTREGAPWCWNMVCDNNRYYHLDLLQSTKSGRFSEFTDDQMTGYVWDYSAYPSAAE